MCMAIKINSSIDSINVLVADLKPLYWALWPGTTVHLFSVSVQNEESSHKTWPLLGTQEEVVSLALIVGLGTG